MERPSSDSTTGHSDAATRLHRCLRSIAAAGALLFAIGAADAEPVVKYRLYGLNFTPYVEGQDPRQDATVSRRQLRERLQIIAPYTRWIRTFGATQGQQEAGRIAHKLGLKAAIGAWIGPADTEAEMAANEEEIANLIARAKKGQVDLAILNGYGMQDGNLTPEQVLGYIQRVKAALPKKRVAYADLYQPLLDHPEIIAAVDVVLFNHWGFWEGYPVEHAVSALDAAYQRLVAAADGKPVFVAETGWPTCGEPLGEAVPSLANANYYFLDFVTWARANRVKYFYSTAFDESWKAAYLGSHAACWGLWDQEGRLKPGMNRVFKGKRLREQ